MNVYAIHPGFIDTDLQRNLQESYPTLNRFVQLPFVKLYLKTPIDGAETTLYCSLDEECANETGLYYA